MPLIKLQEAQLILLKLINRSYKQMKDDSWSLTTHVDYSMEIQFPEYMGHCGTLSLKTSTLSVESSYKSIYLLADC